MPTAKKKTLSQLRKDIDRLDNQMLQLLNERAGLVLDVAEIKLQKDMPVLDPAREKDMLQRLSERNKGPLSRGAIRKVFLQILEHSRKLQTATIKKHVKKGAGSSA